MTYTLTLVKKIGLNIQESILVGIWEDPIQFEKAYENILIGFAKSSLLGEISVSKSKNFTKFYVEIENKKE